MAMDIAQPMRFAVDIDTGLMTMPQRTHLNYGDVNANRIIVAVVRGKTPVDLTGVSATGSFYRPGDGAQISLEGDISANEASVTLIDHCYTVEGQYEAEVKLTQGSTTRTILSITGYVHRAGSGIVVDVTGTVPSLDALLAQIQATKDAAAAANTAAGNANAAATKATNASNNANSAASNADAKAKAAQTAADAANAAEQNWSNGTAANATKLNGKDAKHYLGALNHLDNPDFEIAQAGYYGMHGTERYLCDRWRGSGILGVEKTDNGLLVNVREGVIGFIFQSIKKVAGTVTIASKTSRANSMRYAVYDRNVTTLIAGSGYIDPVNGISTWTVTIPEDAPDIISVLFYVTNGEIIKWADLYEGEYTADNLPPRVPKEYAVELAECQRYYRQSWNGSIITVNASISFYHSNGASVPIVNFETPMRATPTITLYSWVGGAGYIRDWEASTDVSGVSVYYGSSKGFGLVGLGNLTTGRRYAFHYVACADL